MISPQKHELIEFMVQAGVLRFGSFQTKKRTPFPLFH